MRTWGFTFLQKTTWACRFVSVSEDMVCLMASNSFLIYNSCVKVLAVCGLCVHRWFSEAFKPPSAGVACCGPLCNALHLLKAAHCYNTRLISTWTNIFYISLGYVGARQGENQESVWMLALSAGIHTRSHTHTQLPIAPSFVLSWTPCRVWTKHLSALDLTLKHHIMLTFFFCCFFPACLHWHGRKIDLWPLTMSGLLVNVSFKCALPRNVPLRWEIPSYLEIYGESEWKVYKIS